MCDVVHEPTVVIVCINKKSCECADNDNVQNITFLFLYMYLCESLLLSVGACKTVHCDLCIQCGNKNIKKYN